MDNKELALLHQKIDYLTEQFEAQRKRQQALEELQQDMVPIVNHAIKLSIDELAEIGTDFRVEDLLFLLKRLLRDTHLLLRMLDQLEALSALEDEVQLLGRQVFNQVVEALDRLEREGYFAFARGGWYVLEQIVAEFDEEDIRALGDTIVILLKTVRNMTQPDVMALANRAVDALRTNGAKGDKVSTWALIRELGDPQVRQGLARMLNLVKALADQPDTPNLN